MLPRVGRWCSLAEGPSLARGADEAGPGGPGPGLALDAGDGHDAFHQLAMWCQDGLDTLIEFGNAAAGEVNVRGSMPGGRSHGNDYFVWSWPGGDVEGATCNRTRVNDGWRR